MAFFINKIYVVLLHHFVPKVWGFGVLALFADAIPLIL